MDTQKIIEKVRALLNLSEDAGASEAEGETAARMAQLMMAKYGIAQEAVRQAATAEGHAPPKAPIDSVLWGGWKVRTSWLGQLMTASCNVNGCYVYWQHVWDADQARYNYKLRVCGTEHDRQLAIALFELLQEQVNRFTRKECKGLGRTYANNFRHGMVGRLRDRLAEALQQAEQEAKSEVSGSALVLVKTAIVARRESSSLAKGWVKDSLGVKLRSRRTHSRHDSDARSHGYREGDNATLKHDRMGAS
jgi:hypothetical protein